VLYILGRGDSFPFERSPREAISVRFGSEILRARHSAFQEAIKGLALTFHKSGGMLRAKISLYLALNDVWDLLLIIQSLYPEMKFFLYYRTFHGL